MSSPNQTTHGRVWAETTFGVDEQPSRCYHVMANDSHPGSRRLVAGATAGAARLPA